MYRASAGMLWKVDRAQNKSKQTLFLKYFALTASITVSKEKYPARIPPLCLTCFCMMTMVLCEKYPARIPPLCLTCFCMMTMVLCEKYPARIPPLCLTCFCMLTMVLLRSSRPYLPFLMSLTVLFMDIRLDCSVWNFSGVPAFLFSTTTQTM